jgi:mono/diheme cytochrome c family protein
MIFARMTARAQILGTAVAAAAAALGIAACGTQGIKLAKADPNYRGAVLFRDHCSGCHSLSLVGAVGSGFNVRQRERTNGPNFNVRAEKLPQVLYAIENGGFSGAIMPQNVVVGSDAQAVARFLAKYAGTQAKSPPSPH